MELGFIISDVAVVFGTVSVSIVVSEDLQLR